LIITAYREFHLVTNDLIVELRKNQSLVAIQNIDLYAKRSAVRSLKKTGKFSKDELLFICDLFYSVQFYSNDSVRDKIDFSKFSEMLAKITPWANLKETVGKEDTEISENPIKPIIGIAFLTNLFKKIFDPNNDGFVDLQDMVKGLGQIIHGTSIDVLKAIFVLHDSNDDGFLTRDECIQVSESILFLQRKIENEKKLGSVSSFLNRAFMVNVSAETENAPTDDFKLSFETFTEVITADDFLLNYFSVDFVKSFCLIDSNTGVQQTIYVPPMQEITGFDMILKNRFIICRRNEVGHSQNEYHDHKAKNSSK
jgi:hypothetical protein